MATPKKTKTAASKTRKPRTKKVVAPAIAPEPKIEACMPMPKEPEVVDPQYTSDEYPPVAPKYTRIQKAWALMWAGAVVALFVTLYMVR